MKYEKMNAINRVVFNNLLFKSALVTLESWFTMEKGILFIFLPLPQHSCLQSLLIYRMLLVSRPQPHPTGHFEFCWLACFLLLISLSPAWGGATVCRIIAPSLGAEFPPVGTELLPEKNKTKQNRKQCASYFKSLFWEEI